MTGKGLARVTAGVLAFGMQMASAAILVNDASDDFTINWSQAVSKNAYSGTLGAIAVFDVQSISAGEAVFKVTVSNTTTGNFVNAGINSFSFMSDPNSVGSYVTTGSIFDGIANDSVPSFKLHTVCVYAANNCSGGGQPGLLAIGESDTFWLKLAWTGGAELTFPDDRTEVKKNGQPGDTYDNWGIKFQTNIGSYEFAGTTGVPSPAPLALLGAGLLAFVASRRKMGA
jgi:hypothetical protein